MPVEESVFTISQIVLKIHIIITIYSVQNLGKSRSDWAETVTLVPVCLGTCWGLGPLPCIERSGDSVLAPWSHRGAPLQTLAWGRRQPRALASGCCSYDVILIVDCKCLLIPPLTAWPICLVMIALTSRALTNAGPQSPRN